MDFINFILICFSPEGKPPVSLVRLEKALPFPQQQK